MKILYLLFAFITVVVACFSQNAFARITCDSINTVMLEEKPLDIALSNDGATAYILCKEKILVYSTQKNKVIDAIPLTSGFSQIALSSNGEKLFLTDTENKQISILQVTEIFDIKIGQSNVIGKADAPISVFVFSDYQCPYCARLYPVLEQLLKKYPDKVNVVIKHFPLTMHKFARKASLAALAAARQNKYHEFSKALFENYSKLNDEAIKICAEKIELDKQKFEKDYNDATLNKIINQDMQLAKEAKVRAVPALFIKGRPIKNRSLDNLSNIIEQELKTMKQENNSH